MSIPGKNVGSEILDSIERLLNHHREQCSEISTRQLIEVVLANQREQFKEIKRLMTQGFDDLKQAISDVAQAQVDESAKLGDLITSNGNEITAVEAAITKLEGQSGTSDADLQPVIDQLKASVGTFKTNQDAIVASKAAIDAETTKLQGI